MEEKITITCPGCATKVRAPMSLVGKKARCPKCKGVVDVVADLEAVVEAEAQFTPLDESKSVQPSNVADTQVASSSEEEIPPEEESPPASAPARRASGAGRFARPAGKVPAGVAGGRAATRGRPTFEPPKKRGWIKWVVILILLGGGGAAGYMFYYKPMTEFNKRTGEFVDVLKKGDAKEIAAFVEEEKERGTAETKWTGAKLTVEKVEIKEASFSDGKVDFVVSGSLEKEVGKKDEFKNKVTVEWVRKEKDTWYFKDIKSFEKFIESLTKKKEEKKEEKKPGS